ncbi:MAG: hypothetical protein AB7T86_05045 [Xanthobacteraceae bacterium]
MPKRKRPRREARYERFRLAVEAASASVSRMGPGILHRDPDGETSSTITIEGRLDRPAFKDVVTVRLLVFSRDDRTGDPGGAIGGTPWNVVCFLPTAAFANLLALVTSGKLDHVDLLFEDLKRGNARLRTVSFDTAPVPCDAEDEDDAPAG